MAIVSAYDIEPQARAALASSPVFELRDLDVEENDGALLISGVVSSFYHKQLAQEVVRAACRGIEMVNSIKVR